LLKGAWAGVRVGARRHGEWLTLDGYEWVEWDGGLARSLAAPGQGDGQGYRLGGFWKSLRSQSLSQLEPGWGLGGSG
jgi:hypothetical protein